MKGGAQKLFASVSFDSETNKVLKVSRTAISIGFRGRGVCLFDTKAHPPLFSERQGYRRAWRFGRVGFRFFHPEMKLPPPLSGSQLRFRVNAQREATINGDSFFGAPSGTVEWIKPLNTDENGGYLVPPEMATSILDGSFNAYLIERERQRAERCSSEPAEENKNG
jgi:hypothetical protein